MLQIARDCAGRDTPNCFALGNFCSFTGELQQCRDQETATQHKIHNGLAENRLNLTSDKAMSVSDQCDVFLGGSCNPTTWRKDIAIPTLKRYGISFYNPQVAHWDKSLIELEHNAKQKATVLFFVFDRSTRNVASLAEAAYLAASRRKLVLVLDNYRGPGQLINGEAISQREYEELTSGLKTLHDIASRHSIPIFTHIKQAVIWTAKSLRDNTWSMKLDARGPYHSYRSQSQLVAKLTKSSNVSCNSVSSRITLDESCLVFKAVVGRDLTKLERQKIEAAKHDLDESSSSEECKTDILLSFDEFCCIVSEFDNKGLEKKNILHLLSHSFLSAIQKYVDWALPKGHNFAKITTTKDVYLSGSRETFSWRENIAIPFLYKHDLTYNTPSSNPITPTESRFSASEVAAFEDCKVLLFVIDNGSRDISQIARANYCIALGLPVVLCVKMLSQEVTVDGEQLSSFGVKDYNRGRSYLIDQANADHVPVFHDLSDALECVAEKCRAAR